MAEVERFWHNINGNINGTLTPCVPESEVEQAEKRGAQKERERLLAIIGDASDCECDPAYWGGRCGICRLRDELREDPEAAEPDGEHLTSHWILARKVLGESKQFALEVATAFRHRRLTRADCERMATGWDEEDSDA